MQISQLIVTRPQAQAKSLVAELSSMELDVPVIHQPLLSIESLDFEWPSAFFDIAIFISPNAVNHFAAHAKFDADIPAQKLIAVGASTADTLANKSTKAALFPELMNAEGLLAMPEVQVVSQQSILLVKGVGGRTTIKETMQQRGAQVQCLDVYERKLPAFEQQKAIQTLAIPSSVWIVTSLTAMEHLHRILGLAKLSNHATKVIVSSDRLANAAKQKGFSIVAQSTGASDTQLVQCVKSLFLAKEQNSHE